MKEKIIKAEEKYIFSYWNTFQGVIAEKKYLGSTVGFSLKETEKFIKNSINNKYPHYFVINENDECIGWCDIQPKDKRTGYLGIGLAKKYREKGIGKVLIGITLKAAKEYGYSMINLDVRENNKRAIHVYEKMGFKVTNIIMRGIKIDNTYKNVIQMRLDLSKIE